MAINKVNTKVLMFGAWAALLYPSMIIVGWWWLAGFIPPVEPSSTAHDVAHLLESNSFGIRLGMVITMFGAAMALPLGATVAYFISRIEGFFGPLSVLQLMGATCMAVLTFYPPMWWLISSYRVERPEELTLMLSDAAWLQWVGGLTIYYPQIVTIAIASFIDKSEQAVFPRWFGYTNLWLFVLLLPGQLIWFFKAGPFAWSGLLAFYLPFSVFALWFPLAFYLLRKAVLRIEEADLALPRTQRAGA